MYEMITVRIHNNTLCHRERSVIPSCLGRIIGTDTMQQGRYGTDIVNYMFLAGLNRTQAHQ